MRQLLPCLLIFFCGCGLVPKETQSQQTIKQTASLAATRNSELEQRIVSAPQPTIVTSSNPKTGETMTTITPAPAVASSRYVDAMIAEGGEHSTNWYSFTESIPLGVKLILLAIGVGMFLAIWLYVRKVSLAAQEAGELADHVLAEQIQRLREKAIAATDHRDIAMHSTEIAALEAQRGRLAKKKK